MSWKPTQYPVVENSVVRGLFIDEFGAHFIEETDAHGEVGWRVYLYTAPEFYGEDNMPINAAGKCLFWKSAELYFDLKTAMKAYDGNWVEAWYWLGIIHRSKEDGLKKKPIN